MRALSETAALPAAAGAAAACGLRLDAAASVRNAGRSSRGLRCPARHGPRAASSPARRDPRAAAALVGASSRGSGPSRGLARCAARSARSSAARGPAPGVARGWAAARHGLRAAAVPARRGRHAPAVLVGAVVTRLRRVAPDGRRAAAGPLLAIVRWVSLRSSRSSRSSGRRGRDRRCRFCPPPLLVAVAGCRSRSGSTAAASPSRASPRPACRV